MPARREYLPVRPALTLRELRGGARRRRREAAIRWLFFSAALISIVVSGLIVLSLAQNAVAYLTRIDLPWLWTTGWFPRRDQFDIKTIFAGTMIVSVIAMLVAAPLGLGAAIYLSQYARRGVRRLLKPILEVLAGIPSVVMGFFALTIISPELVQRLFGASNIFNMAAAGVGVGILVIPLVASVAEDAMIAVPHSLAEAAYGLGAKKMTTSIRVVFPAAISGIVAALIVGLSRAIGETMVVAIVAGGTGGALFTLNPLNQGQTMTGAIAALATGTDRVRGSGATFDSLFFVGLLLFGMTFALNLVSEGFVRKTRKRY